MQIKPILNLRNFLIILGISFQFSVLFSLVQAKYVSLADDGKVGMDFLSIYSAGYIIRYDSPANMYNLKFQGQIQDMVLKHNGQVGIIKFYHPPILAPLLGLVTTMDINESYLRWISILILFQLASIGLLIKVTKIFMWSRSDILIMLVSGLLFYPTYVGLIRGQDSTFLLLGICLWVVGLTTSEDRAAGLGLAMAMIRPQIALVLAIPFLIKRRRVWWWFLIWGFVLLILSYIFIGLNGIIGFGQAILLSSQDLILLLEKYATFMGAIIRIFPGISNEEIYTIGYFGYLISILCLCYLWSKSSNIGLKQMNLAILSSVLFTPYLNTHDLVILLVPAIIVVQILADNRKSGEKFSIILPMLVSTLLIIGDLMDVYIMYYLVIFSLALVTWKPGLFVHHQRIT